MKKQNILATESSDQTKIAFKKDPPARCFSIWVFDKYLELPKEYIAREIRPGTFEVTGGTRPYRTSEKSCDCHSTKNPCKHRAALIIELKGMLYGQ